MTSLHLCMLFTRNKSRTKFSDCHWTTHLDVLKEAYNINQSTDTDTVA